MGWDSTTALRNDHQAPAAKSRVEKKVVPLWRAMAKKIKEWKGGTGLRNKWRFRCSSYFYRVGPGIYVVKERARRSYFRLFFER